MTTIPPTNTNPTTGTSSTNSSTASLNSLSTDFNQFLTLLTTQLKNQDPLSPMDSTQFTAQLVAFTGVEQQINTNSKLDTLIGVDKSTELTSAANFVGKTVVANSSSTYLTSGTPVQIGYTLPSAASAATIQITDANGNIVRTIQATQAQLAQGANVVSWDGKSDSGSQEPTGAYTVTVQGTDQNQAQLTGITTSIIGTVTGVISDATNGTELAIGTVKVKVSDVTNLVG